MARAFVTGARGLIGKEVLSPLLASGFEIYALTTAGTPPADSDGVRWLSGNLFDRSFIRSVFAEVRPTHLLHLAWETNQGYLTAEVNYDLRDASLDMLDCFARSGGAHAVYAGTSFEYEAGDGPLREDGPLRPATPYARCKDELRQKASALAASLGVGFSWCRIFFIYGHNERKQRFVANITGNLAAGREAVVRNGGLVRDYLYSRDVAAALVACLRKGYVGPVNICSGTGVALGELARTFAKAMGREHLLTIREDPTDAPPILVGDNTRLRTEVGFIPQFDAERAAMAIVEGMGRR